MRRRLGPVFHCLLLSLSVGCTAASTNPDPGDDTASSTSSGPPPAPDEDGDGISDEDEGRATEVDTDGDGTPDYQDDDSDGDGIADAVEAVTPTEGEGLPDTDSDGTPDFQDSDSDGNGRTDGVDAAGDLDEDGRPDFADVDDDGDGLTDVLEIGADASVPVDTDGDTSADFRDLDSDNDTIGDRFEGTIDADGDGLPAYRDLDSDDDCRPDSVEAGDLDASTPPIDSDLDGGADFVDIDSDNDGLLDRLEDVNCNGMLDDGESSTAAEDTDADGVTDLVEVAAGTNPDDALDNPLARGDFVFTVPYQQPPDPEQDTLDFSTNISQADVAFLMDTTGSMGGEIDNLQTTLQTMIGQLAIEIPSIGIGVSDFKDFPFNFYGDSADEPFSLKHRVMSVLTPAGRASVQSAVDGLFASGGADGPESNWEALFQATTGVGTTQGNANVPPFNPLTAPPSVIPPGESIGTLGGMGFRAGSLPIAVLITDVPGHNGVNPANDYQGFTAANYRQATAALSAIGGRLIGLVATDFGVAEARGDLVAGAVATGSVVPPSAWGPDGMRPGNCAIDQCCTGANGAGEPASNGKCPLVFRVSGSGAGLTNSVVQAIKVLTTYVTLDIAATAQDDPSDSVDAVSAFVDSVRANTLAPMPCTAGLPVADRNVDGVADTFTNVFPGPTVCFDVIPRRNVTVRPTLEPQMFKANILVTGDNVTTLSTRSVFFLVPPEIPDPPVN
jgi:hypothetical protein